MKEIISRPDVSTEKSAGFGDSDSDIFFMNLVEIPIALNATEKTKAHAKEKGWAVIDSKDFSKEEAIEAIKKLIS